MFVKKVGFGVLVVLSFVGWLYFTPPLFQGYHFGVSLWLDVLLISVVVVATLALGAALLVIYKLLFDDASLQHIITRKAVISTKRLHLIAYIAFGVGIFGGLVGGFVLKLLLGVHGNMVPNAPVVVNRETIVFTMGTLVFFAIHQALAFREKNTRNLVDAGAFFLVYAALMGFYSTDILVWIAVTGVVLSLLAVESIFLKLLWRRRSAA